MRYIVMGITLLAVAGCQRGPSPEVQAQLDQLSQVAGEKDRLIDELAQTARLMSEIGSELAKVQSAERVAAAKIKSESPSTAQRDTLMWRVQDVVARVRQGESRLGESRRRIQALTHVSDSLKAQLEQTVAQFQSTLDVQKETITELNTRLEVAQAQNVELTARTVALEDTVRSQSVAYYVVGTKQELLQRGIVVEEGGSRVLFVFGKRGKTLQPARDLPLSEFTPIDARSVRQIPLPDPEAEYRIASRQNVEYLATPPDEQGEIRGPALDIAAPDRFWLPSKFLIIVKSSD
ncbi:MAG TPA: hypothetical protein VD793_05520 [Gemmatimonadales bacterium]|nr:hypothetical protein [Gemmatimonadales bacterium]